MLDKIMVTGPEKHPRAAYARTAGTRLPRGRRGQQGVGRGCRLFGVSKSMLLKPNAQALNDVHLQAKCPLRDTDVTGRGSGAG